MSYVWAVANQRAAFSHVTNPNEAKIRGFVWNKLFIRKSKMAARHRGTTPPWQEPIREQHGIT